MTAWPDLAGSRAVAVSMPASADAPARVLTDVAGSAGRLIARGAPGEVMTPAALQTIYGVAMGIMTHPTSGLPISYVA